MQQLHMDFKEMDEPEDVQLPFFVGIMTSHVDMVTNQELFDRKYTRVYYDIGDLIIMHGNQMHRGCSYEHLNMRIYFYAVNQNLGDNNKNGQYSYKSAQDLPERHPSHS